LSRAALASNDLDGFFRGTPGARPVKSVKSPRAIQAIGPALGVKYELRIAG